MEWADLAERSAITRFIFFLMGFADACACFCFLGRERGDGEGHGVLRRPRRERGCFGG